MIYFGNKSARWKMSFVRDPLMAKRGLEKYFRLYNQSRPHSSLVDKTPNEFYYDNMPALPKAA
jgi:transposase InsO family protein